MIVVYKNRVVRCNFFHRDCEGNCPRLAVVPIGFLVVVVTAVGRKTGNNYQQPREIGVFRCVVHHNQTGNGIDERLVNGILCERRRLRNDFQSAQLFVVVLNVRIVGVEGPRSAGTDKFVVAVRVEVECTASEVDGVGIGTAFLAYVEQTVSLVVHGRRFPFCVDCSVVFDNCTVCPFRAVGKFDGCVPSDKCKAVFNGNGKRYRVANRVDDCVVLFAVIVHNSKSCGVGILGVDCSCRCGN